MLVCRTQAKYATTCLSALWLVVRNCGSGVWWPLQLGCLWPCLLIGVEGCARLPPAAHGVYLESSELIEAGPSTRMLDMRAQLQAGAACEPQRPSRLPVLQATAAAQAIAAPPLSAVAHAGVRPYS